MPWDLLARSDAIIFGSPTYLGNVSARFKQFQEDSSGKVWRSLGWRDNRAIWPSPAFPSGSQQSKHRE